ncbi:MAG TPA: malonyl-ACP O-methyltransferase BioC [Steroidobacteraceae bacterium]|jgi:malonyl-CoA O-methyltransferase|nr:malonyl-ACP O-methyltransferase BioC [Steroidobacteraceae bacterium]
MSDEIGAYALESRWVRRSFDRAASTFDAAAVLHKEVRENLLERLQLTKLDPRVVVDAGAGTGHGSRALKRRYPGAVVVALDSSPQMLKTAARQQSWRRKFERVCADAELLPLGDGSVDLIVSNLMLQWCNPDTAFAEFRRVLAPQGLLAFSAFGPDTLRELRSAWSQVDAHSHVHQFIDMHDLGDALVRNGFAAPVLDVERFTLRYVDVRKVAADLKATGAHNATVGRAKGLTGPRKFAAMQAAYERFRQEGRLPATYEVVFAHAWVPAHAPRRAAAEPASVSLEEIKRELRARRAK